MLRTQEYNIIREILGWYDEYGRDFPWRHTEAPYKVMIAEFMLQRTKAEQVLPVYSQFIEKYPDVESLALAEPEQIKDVTKHLGLHRRASQFLESARFVVETFNGQFPDNEELLRKIPGVGEYISRAILAVCFNKSSNPVDSNIARFINRFYFLNLTGEIRRKKIILEKATELFQCDQPGIFLFAIVDFTTFICKPTKPLCSDCPISSDCRYDELSQKVRDGETRLSHKE